LSHRHSIVSAVTSCAETPRIASAIRHSRSVLPNARLSVGDWGPAVGRRAAETGYEFAFTMPSVGRGGLAVVKFSRVPVDYRDEERPLG